MNWKQQTRRLINAICMAVVSLAAFALVRRRRGPVRRSLWAGTPIINMAVNARAEKLLGVDTRTLVYSTYVLTSDFDYNLSWWMRWPGLRSFVPYVVLLWAAMRFDRFHFYCDRGLLPSIDGRTFNESELRFLRRLGKEIYCWTYGADVRTQHVTRALGDVHCCTACPEIGKHCICSDELNTENVGRLMRYADNVFAMGDMIEYTPGSRNDLFFWPVDVDGWNAAKYRPHYPEAHSQRPLRIVHAPNHRHFKGSQYLIDAVARLRREGVDLELLLVERIPNDEALQMYRSADLVFDQCLIGFHGYFALEAMALGKPVMVFIRKPAEYLIDHENCPFINTRHNEIARRIRELANNRQRLHDLGVAGRRYIDKHFSLNAFAARLERAYAEGRHDARNHRRDGSGRIHRTDAHRAAA